MYACAYLYGLSTADINFNTMMVKAVPLEENNIQVHAVQIAESIRYVTNLLYGNSTPKFYCCINAMP